MSVLTRQQVGRFEIRDELGRGAIGDVVLAWDPARREEVALKVVRVSRTDPEMLEAERNGVALQAQLARRAPQVAAVYEQGVDGDYFWVAMEYVEGEDLSQRLARGPLSEPRAVAIALQLLAMLEVCHDFSAEVGGRQIHGIVHGDIKPENIRIQRAERAERIQHADGDGDDGCRGIEDRVRLLDFGIAKHLSQTRRFTINLFGSLPYTPPERLDRGVVDRHSDLWAVGVVLYIMLSGRRPFPGDTPEEVERRIRRGEPPLPLPAGIAPSLRRIVQKSLAFDVERRYATAAEFRADLEAFREEWLAGAPAGANGAADLEATRRTRVPLGGEAAAAGEIGGDGTRRTVPPLDAGGAGPSEATRRTDRVPAAPPLEDGPAGAAPAAGVPAWAPATSPPGAGPGNGAPAGEPLAGGAPTAVPSPDAARAAAPRSRAGRTLLVVMGLLAVLVGTSQAWVRGEARDLRAELLADGHPDLMLLAERYRQAARIALPGSGLGTVREELHDRLTREANRILDSYHGDDPTTGERGWRQAADYLRAAVEVDWRDRASRARLDYARAHLARIESQALRAKGQRQEAAERSKEALTGFREAAQRDRDWPDPYLGIARIYAYDLFDLDKLQEALGELGRRGYKLGRREKAMLADGFRMRGRQFQAQAERARGKEEEGELLEQAKADFEQAIAFYDEIPTFGDVAANRADVQQRLDGILARRWEIYAE
jgi:eukaryotic-like serine/threonine-protein kinase